MNAPVVVFAYKRYEHIRRVLEALNKNYIASQSDVYIFCDAAKGENDREDVNRTRKYLEEFKRNNSFLNCYLYFAEFNKGLASSIIDGVSYVLKKYEKVIVVEDDLVTSRDFLQYMNDALEYYKNDKEIGAISGFTYPLKSLKDYPFDIYFTRTGNSWGWGTWKTVWDKVDWKVSNYKKFRNSIYERWKFNNTQKGISDMLDRQMQEKIDSWAVRWDYHFFINDLMTVYPVTTKVCNIGFDETGTNCNNKERKFAEAHESEIQFCKVKLDKRIMLESAGYKVTILSKLLHGF